MAGRRKSLLGSMRRHDGDYSFRSLRTCNGRVLIHPIDLRAAAVFTLEGYGRWIFRWEWRFARRRKYLTRKIQRTLT